MFTGIVEDKGKVHMLEPRGQGKRLTIIFPSHLTDVQVGDSININGVCLTVIEKKGPMVRFDLSSETLEKSALGDLKESEEVNLERALRITDRLGGHIVTGHIDGVGVVTGRREERDFLQLRIRVPRALSKFVVQKGSIAIDGISLTVNEILDEEIGVTLVPYTLAKTTVSAKSVGDRVNVETDVLGKYVEGILSRGKETPKGLDLSFLREHGFINEE
ncbi:MAG: riboflavin synthase subunit alpha [Deltaproteobacteria bacterium RBG_13_53_10]|nr:MAG: riboflavin synthase subunit alpha [Deltaproteobacteria bacterium RBG_13_53_10]